MGPVASTGRLALAALAALLAAWLSGESMVVVRKLNARAARAARPALQAGSGDAVMSLQLRGLVSDFLRGGIVTGVALALAVPAYTALGALWVGSAATERAVLAGLTAALGGATIWMLVRNTPGARASVVIGLIAGMAMLI
jgi:hypothetical protein